MANFFANYPIEGLGSAFTPGNLTDVGTDGIVITGGTGAVNGAGTQIAQHVADASHNGYLSSVDWSTFNAKQAALTIGNLTDAGTDGITVTGGTGAVIGSGTSLSQHVADSTHNGYLSSADWSTFNAKQATVTIGALDAQAENADGLALVAGVLSTQSADATHPGVVNNTTQTLGGNKTFIRGTSISGTSDEVQLSIQGNSSQSNRLVQFLTSGFGDLGSIDNSGNLRVTGNISATAGGSVTAGSYFGASANSATTGLYNLTHADLIAFRNQLNNGDLTLGVNSSNVFTFSSSIGATNFSGSSSGSNTGDQTISLTGDVTASGGTGSLTTAYNGTVPLNKGGTGQTTKAPAFDALSPMSAAGDVILGGASGTGTRLAIGSNTFVLTSNGTTASWASNAAAAAATTTTAGIVKLPSGSVNLDTGNGYGSTNTKIRRFTNNSVVGTSLTYADSATLGGAITAVEAGLYSIYYSDRSSSIAVNSGLSVNTTLPTTNIDGVTDGSRVAIQTLAVTNVAGSLFAIVKLAANDVLRAHNGNAGGLPDSTGNTVVNLVINQLCKL